MRIVHLGKYYPPVWGGIETITWDLVEGCNRRGIACDVIVAGGGRRSAVETRSTPALDYRVIRAASPLTVASTPISPAYLNVFRETCGDYDLAILHLPNPLACLALYISGFEGKVGLIWHSDIIRQRVLLRAFRWLQTWTIRRADFVVGATPAHLQESENASLFEGKGHLVPFGLDDPSAELAAQPKRAEQERISVLSVGRLVYYKGFDVLIDAMARLESRYELVIVGEGPLRRKLEMKIQSLGLQHRVRLAGRVSPRELQAHFARCDIFCLPSVERSEMYGMVQLEAMAFERPLVVTAIAGSGTRYVLRDGVTGITVPPADAAALATAVRSLGENPDLRQRYGRAARALYEEEYTVDRMVERHIQLYRNVLHRPG